MTAVKASIFDAIFDSASSPKWRDAVDAEWQSPNCSSPLSIPSYKTVRSEHDPTAFLKVHQGDLLVGCERCDHCRRRYWLQKAASAYNEGTYYNSIKQPVSFLTLTLDDAHLTRDRSGEVVLNWDAFTGFMKRLRINISRLPDGLVDLSKLRFAAVGEYGEKFGRPHWHVFLFGFPPCDHGQTRGDLMADGLECCWQCRLIQRSWGQGNIRLETVRDSGKAARYLVNYMLSDQLSGNAHVKPPIWRASRHLGHQYDLQVAADIKAWLLARYVSDIDRMPPERVALRQKSFRSKIRLALIEGRHIPYAGRRQLVTIMKIIGETTADRDENLRQYLADSDASDRRRHMSGMSVSDLVDQKHKARNDSRAAFEKIKRRPK